MRLHRFYSSEKVGPDNTIVIRDANQFHQIRSVFRMKKDALLIVFNGTHFDYECKIDEIDMKTKICVLNVISTSRSRSELARDVDLVASVVKKDTFEWITKQATELGVARIMPVISEHSEKKALNESRLQKIAIEASEQSGRGSIPAISPIHTLRETIEKLKGRDDTSGKMSMVAFHTEGEQFERGEIPNDGAATVFIGPEGGWSPEEVNMFHREGIAVRTLGPQILRAETAVVAALSQVVFE